MDKERGQIDKLLQEAIEEGLFDKIKSAIGIGSTKDNKFKLIPKKQWEDLLGNNRQIVERLANTPRISDAAQLVANVLEELSGLGSIEARDIDEQMKQALKDRNREELAQLIGGIRAEADAIRTVRPASGGIDDDIERIADVVSEDINMNNGLIID